MKKHAMSHGFLVLIDDDSSVISWKWLLPSDMTPTWL